LGEGAASTSAFAVTRSNSSGMLTVGFTLSGTATSGMGQDYQITPAYVQFMHGQSTVNLNVAPNNDSTSEPTETIICTLNSGSGYTVGNPSSATINLLDNDAQVVTVVTKTDAVEGGVEGRVQFTRIGDLSNSLVANYSVGGTATEGDDYEELSGTVTFAAGSATVDLLIEALHDGVYDPDETVTVTVSSGTGYTIGAADESEVTIGEDAEITFTLDTYEGAIWYEIPWEDVDPGEATQSLPLADFALFLAGHLLTEATADFTTSPTAEFEDGILVGITFAIDTSEISGFPCTSISADGGLELTAIVPGTGAVPIEAAVKEPAILLDFSVYNTGGAERVLYISWRLSDAPDNTIVTNVTIPAAATGGDVRNLVLSVMKDHGLDATGLPGGRLLVKGTAKGKLTRLMIDVITPPEGWVGPAIKGKVTTDDITPRYYLNNTEYNP
jgi:hypothetical protein